MTKTLNKTLVAAGALLVLTATSNAAVLASFDAWGNYDGSGDHSADSTLTGFTAVIASTESVDRSLTGFGSNDTTFGTEAGAANDNQGLLVRSDPGGGADQLGTPLSTLTITLTNGTASAYNITSFHFDLGVRGSVGGDGYNLDYTSGGLGPASTNLGSISGNDPDDTFSPNDFLAVTGDLANYHDFDFDLTALLSDFTLGAGESAEFSLRIQGYQSGSASSVLDNVLFQGTAVPEPSNFALLAGCFGLAWVMVRRRA